MLLTLALGLLLVPEPKTAEAPDDVWPQWRGPTADSVAPGKNLPTQWSKTANVAWKTPLPGWGNSTPAIWKDALFVTTQDKEKLLALRIDTGNGKIAWQRQVGTGTPRRSGALGNLRFHDEQNMASPSPVTDGKHVWFHFGTGDLACYDFEGAKVWSQNLADKYGFYSIWWGHANSPLLVGDLLISVCMQDPKNGGKSYVLAQDKLTGKEKWLVTRDTGASGEPADSYTTPLLYQNKHKGRTELIVFGGNVLDAYDPANGKRLWQSMAFKGNRVISGPTLAGDTVYAVQGMKGPLFAIKVGGDGDVTATHVLWKYGKDKGAGNPDAASPVFANGLIFMASNDGTAICVEGDTGKEMWKERLGDEVRATPLVADGKIYFISKHGKATIVEARQTFKILSQPDLGEEIIASPAAAQGSLFLRTKENLYRIGGGK